MGGIGRSSVIEGWLCSRCRRKRRRRASRTARGFPRVHRPTCRLFWEFVYIASSGNFWSSIWDGAA